MNEQPYDSEKLLQSWLAKYPALLVGNQINTKEPRRWLFIEQECSVPAEEGGAGRWAIDHNQFFVPLLVLKIREPRHVAKLDKPRLRIVNAISQPKEINPSRAIFFTCVTIWFQLQYS